jgi:hypothetical protein
LAGEKAPGFRVFLRVVLEIVVRSGGVFVVSLWWIAWPNVVRCMVVFGR